MHPGQRTYPTQRDSGRERLEEKRTTWAMHQPASHWHATRLELRHGTRGKPPSFSWTRQEDQSCSSNHKPRPIGHEVLRQSIRTSAGTDRSSPRESWGKRAPDRLGLPAALVGCCRKHVHVRGPRWPSQDWGRMAVAGSSSFGRLALLYLSLLHRFTRKRVRCRRLSCLGELSFAKTGLAMQAPCWFRHPVRTEMGSSQASH